jgi:thiamine monophosphate synthase
MDIVGMDRSHVARIEIHLDRKDLVEYRFKQEEREFYINFEDLAKKCKRFGKQEDAIMINLNADQVIQFQCHGIHFCQKNLDCDTEERPVPKVEFKDSCTANLTEVVSSFETP